MTKLGGVIGAVVGFLFPFVVSDHIDWLADHTNWNDYLGTAIGIVFAVGGWAVGSWAARQLKARFARSHTLAH